MIISDLLTPKHNQIKILGASTLSSLLLCAWEGYQCRTCRGAGTQEGQPLLLLQIPCDLGLPPAKGRVTAPSYHLPPHTYIKIPFLQALTPFSVQIHTDI